MAFAREGQQGHVDTVGEQKGQTLLIQFIDTVAREVMSWDL